ncbi:hypothetical protein HDV00_000091 [Rhizophlyctis rosea]|nr:hypothetical protein HDV00_000091 [Rhizophlyctis rosea]
MSPRARQLSVSTNGFASPPPVTLASTLADQPPTPPPSPEALHQRRSRRLSHIAKLEDEHKPLKIRKKPGRKPGRKKKGPEAKDEKEVEVQPLPEISTTVDNPALSTAGLGDFQRLTPVILLQILKHLDLATIVRCIGLSHAWKALLEDQPMVDVNVWHEIYEREFENALNVEICESLRQTSWRKRCTISYLQLRGSFFTTLISDEPKCNFLYPCRTSVIPRQPDPTALTKTFHFALPAEDQRLSDDASPCPQSKTFLLPPANMYDTPPARHHGPSLCTIFQADGLRGKSHLQTVRLPNLHVKNKQLNEHSSPVFDSALSHEYQTLVTSSLFPGDRVWMHNLHDRTKKDALGLCCRDPSELWGQYQPLTCVATDGPLVCTALEGVVYIWDMGIGLCKGLVHTGEDVETMALKGNLLAVYTIPYNTIQIHSLFPDSHLHTFSHFDEVISYPKTYRPLLQMTNRLLFASTPGPAGRVYVFDLLAMNILYSLEDSCMAEQNTFITSMALSHWGPAETLAVGFANGDMVLFDFSAHPVDREVEFLDKEEDPKKGSTPRCKIMPTWLAYREGSVEKIGRL